MALIKEILICSSEYFFRVAFPDVVTFRDTKMGRNEGPERPSGRDFWEDVPLPPDTEGQKKLFSGAENGILPQKFFIFIILNYNGKKIN